MAPTMARRNLTLKPRDLVAPREFLRALFDSALAASDPRRAIAEALPAPVSGRTVVVGAGKASAAMARAFETNWPGDLNGLVVTRHGHAMPCQRIQLIQPRPPVPPAPTQPPPQR